VRKIETLICGVCFGGVDGEGGKFGEDLEVGNEGEIEKTVKNDSVNKAAKSSKSLKTLSILHKHTNTLHNCYTYLNHQFQPLCLST
jgi:hypothetical protein